MDCCKNCPMYWNECDYWGEWDEGCELHYCGWFNGKGYKLICYMPIFIKKLYLRYYRWREEIRWEKFIREGELKEDLNQLMDELEKMTDE